MTRVAGAAILISLSATGSIAALVCGVGFFIEADQLVDRNYISVVDCAVGPDERSVLALSWLLPAHAPAEDLRLSQVDLDGAAQPAAQRTVLTCTATCLAGCQNVESVLIGEQDGSLRICYGSQRLSSISYVGRQCGEVRLLERSTDGRYFLSASSDDLGGWNLDAACRLWQRGDLCVSSAAYQPGSTKIVCGLVDGRLIEIDGLTGYTLRELARFSGPVLATRFDRFGQRLACVASDGRMVLFHWPSATVAWRDTGPSSFASGFRALCFSPCGRWLVAAAKNHVSALAVWDVDAGQHIGNLRGHAKAVNGACFGARGTLFSWSADGTIRRWDVSRLRELNVLTVTAECRPAPETAT